MRGPDDRTSASADNTPPTVINAAQAVRLARREEARRCRREKAWTAAAANISEEGGEKGAAATAAKTVAFVESAVGLAVVCVFLWGWVFVHVV